MKILNLFKPLSFLPALAVMYMIFSFSAQNADMSSQLSFKVSRTIVRSIDTIADMDWEEWQIDEHAYQIEHLVRKCAHMGEYFLLAVSVSFPLYVYGLRGFLLMLSAGLFCVAFACGDEYHQSFVEGRGPSSRDVLVDSTGVLIGIILVRLIGWSGRMAITGPIYERRQKKEARELDRRERELNEREKALSRREMEATYRRAARRMKDRPFPNPDYSENGFQTDKDYIPPEPFKDEPVFRKYENDIVSDPDPDNYSSDVLSEDMPLPKFLRGH